MDAASAAQRGRFPQLAKYELLEELGHGGMATVYRALDRRLGREVAVKVIHPHLRDSPEVVSRFNTEARAVAKLRHPNIVEVFDVSDPDEPEQYLVVELLGGTTLRKLLQRHKAMPPEVAAALAIELLGALAHAHANGVVHRDVKPENVLIEHRASGPAGRATTVVKLTDFGIAKLLDAQGVTSTGQVLGSPAHMAPEQIEGADVDARADVFGLGVLVYECMVGHLPFEGANPAQVLRRVLDGRYPDAQRERPIVGSQWSAILDRALAHAPGDRFTDATAMRAATSAELDRLGVSAPAEELEAWLESPVIFEQAHAKRMVDRLCALGNDARKRHHVLAAAADYNRALAHAPDDPHLLRIVATMNRAEARARFARRAAVALVLMVGLGAVAFGVGRWARTHAAPSGPPAPSAATQVVSAQTPRSAGGPALAVSELPVPSASTQHLARAPAATVASRFERIERTITLELTPPMGVKLSIDGAAAIDESTQATLRLDTKPHLLVFDCAVCTPVQVALAAGDKDDRLSVNVPVKPATLQVSGDGDKTYQIVEDPQLVIRAGQNTVALKSQYRSITVRQIETDERRPIRLVAGQEIRVTF
ncbi:MAG: serine/threonine-protein kinase [Polyangiaceae bacterium]